MCQLSKNPYHWLDKKVGTSTKVVRLHIWVILCNKKAAVVIAPLPFLFTKKTQIYTLTYMEPILCQKCNRVQTYKSKQHIQMYKIHSLK